MNGWGDSNSHEMLRFRSNTNAHGSTWPQASQQQQQGPSRVWSQRQQQQQQPVVEFEDETDLYGWAGASPEKMSISSDYYVKNYDSDEAVPPVIRRLGGHKRFRQFVVGVALFASLSLLSVTFVSKKTNHNNSHTIENPTYGKSNGKPSQTRVLLKPLGASKVTSKSSRSKPSKATTTTATTSKHWINNGNSIHSHMGESNKNSGSPKHEFFSHAKKPEKEDRRFVFKPMPFGKTNARGGSSSSSSSSNSNSNSNSAVKHYKNKQNNTSTSKSSSSTKSSRTSDSTTQTADTDTSSTTDDRYTDSSSTSIATATVFVPQMVDLPPPPPEVVVQPLLEKTKNHRTKKTTTTSSTGTSTTTSGTSSSATTETDPVPPPPPPHPPLVEPIAPPLLTMTEEERLIAPPLPPPQFREQVFYYNYDDTTETSELPNVVYDANGTAVHINDITEHNLPIVLEHPPPPIEEEEEQFVHETQTVQEEQDDDDNNNAETLSADDTTSTSSSQNTMSQSYKNNNTYYTESKQKRHIYPVEWENRAYNSSDQLIIVSTVATMALLVGALSARRMRSRHFLSSCIENESLEDELAYDTAYTSNSHTGGYDTFGSTHSGLPWRGDLEKFDV